MQLCTSFICDIQINSPYFSRFYVVKDTETLLYEL